MESSLVFVIEKEVRFLNFIKKNFTFKIPAVQISLKNSAQAVPRALSSGANNSPGKQYTTDPSPTPYPRYILSIASNYLGKQYNKAPSPDS